MEMRITKNGHRAHSIVYKRDNGTATWMQADDFFVQHDLGHYAIEKTAGYTGAFMGMLNRGMDIRDFEHREKRKALIITREGWYAEHLANLFLIEIAPGDFPDFNKVSADAFANMNPDFPAPRLPAAMLATIRNCLKNLLACWNNLPAGGTMTLNFDL